MGLYDIFIVKAECPRCGRLEEFEFQTKDLGKNMFVWRQGEKFWHPTIEIIKGKIRGCITSHDDCPNPNLIDEQTGYKATIFYADIVIENGIVVGTSNIREGLERVGMGN